MEQQVAEDKARVRGREGELEVRLQREFHNAAYRPKACMCKSFSSRSRPNSLCRDRARTCPNLIADAVFLSTYGTSTMNWQLFYSGVLLVLLD